jgi:hypothetical protein
LLKVCLQENGRATEFWSYDSNRKAPNLVVWQKFRVLRQ